MTNVGGQQIQKVVLDLKLAHLLETSEVCNVEDAGVFVFKNKIVLREQQDFNIVAFRI